ncbi:MAG: alanine dehydrogenase [Spirochaetaceae bacterium]|nr:alanine dehydrogenase [Spirochaetaceae bacterium]
MTIGVPKEIKNNENRVAMTPTGVEVMVKAGHQVFVETNGGNGSGFTDAEYVAAGATMVTAKEAWGKEMVVKVKEPLKEEYAYFYEGLILFTYLHLAAEEELTKALIDKKVVAIAYETVELADGSLPLLTPMSEVAGRMATQIGARFLERPQGGIGMLLGGIPGVKAANVAVIGGGIVGTNAAKMAVGMGANVTILDSNPKRLRELDDLFGNSAQTLMSNSANIAEAVKESNLVIGAVLIPGAKAPKLVSEEMVKAMKPRSVIVDVAIDQGGIFATIDRITTHAEPTYEKHGVVHYAVANMPGAVPRTSTFGLTNVTLPYALLIASKGYKAALADNKALLKGLNVYQGKVTYKAVSEAFSLPFSEATALL